MADWVSLRLRLHFLKKDREKVRNIDSLSICIHVIYAMPFSIIGKQCVNDSECLTQEQSSCVKSMRINLPRKNLHTDFAIAGSESNAKGEQFANVFIYEILFVNSTLCIFILLYNLNSFRETKSCGR